MKKILLPFPACRRQAKYGSSRFVFNITQNSNWRCILELARTEFCPHPASRDSE